MARPAARGRLRLSARARALRRRADGPAMVRIDRSARPTIRAGPRSAGAAWSRRGPRSTPSSTRSSSASGSTNSRLALVGFSQGAMMALHVGLRRRRAPAAIVGYSGLLVGPERLKEATARDPRGAPPPILLIHGDQDPVIPVEAMFMAAEALAQAIDPGPMASLLRRRPRHRRRRIASRRPISGRGPLPQQAVIKCAEGGPIGCDDCLRHSYGARRGLPPPSKRLLAGLFQRIQPC